MSKSWKTALFVLTIHFMLASPSEGGFVDRVFETTLDNGLKVILLENHAAPAVTFQVWYRAGARKDPWGKTGLAHVLEHLMFKGTKTVSGEAFTRTIQENGGRFNAFTSYDFAAFFETLASDRLRIAVDLEADRMTNLVLRDEDFQTERQVVMEERRLRIEDDPKADLTEQVSAAAFQTQPYHWPVIGWMEDLSRLTVADARDGYRRYYHPGNAFVVLVGDFDTEKALSMIRDAFGTIPQGPPADRYRYQDPPQKGERRILVEREAQLPYLAMGYHVPNLRDEESYVLEVIAALLSKGGSSRLQENLVRKQGLALSARAEHSLVAMDDDLFWILVEPLPGIDPARLEQAVDEEIERLQQETVGARELQKVQNALEAGLIYRQDSPFGQAMLLAGYEIASTWRDVKEYIPSIRRVTAEEIRRVARRTLVPRNRTVGTLVPAGKHANTGRPAPKGD